MCVQTFDWWCVLFSQKLLLLTSSYRPLEFTYFDYLSFNRRWLNSNIPNGNLNEFPLQYVASPFLTDDLLSNVTLGLQPETSRTTGAAFCLEKAKQQQILLLNILHIVLQKSD